MKNARQSAAGGDAETVRRFLAERFLFRPDAEIDPRASLLGEGVLDSTGAMELVLFIEQSFGVAVDDHELVPENLDSIEQVVSFVARKRLEMRAPARLEALDSRLKVEGSRASTR